MFCILHLSILRPVPKRLAALIVLLFSAASGDSFHPCLGDKTLERACEGVCIRVIVSTWLYASQCLDTLIYEVLGVYATYTSEEACDTSATCECRYNTWQQHRQRRVGAHVPGGMVSGLQQPQYKQQHACVHQPQQECTAVQQQCIVATATLVPTGVCTAERVFDLLYTYSVLVL